MKEGRDPSLEDIAEEAMVSRATAYRYFSGVEALLVEAALDVAMPDESFLRRRWLGGRRSSGCCAPTPPSPAMVRDNEAALRAMLVHSLQRGHGRRMRLPVRQNRRTPLIEQALAPARDALPPPDFTRLAHALALVIGTEFDDRLPGRAGDRRRRGGRGPRLDDPLPGRRRARGRGPNVKQAYKRIHGLFNGLGLSGLPSFRI